MKKMMMRAVMCGMMLALTASVDVKAQSLGDIFGKVTNTTGNDNKSDSKTNSLISSLTTIFSSNKQATTSNLIGTWVYTEPAIVFQSDNVLTNVAAKVAAQKVEKNLQAQLTKYGIKPGAMTMTLNSDGTFTETISGKKLSGTWKVVDKKLQMTYGGAKSVSLTTQLSGNNLMFVTDATKLLTLFKTIANASGNANLQTVTSLMKNVKGMQAGITMKKK